MSLIVAVWAAISFTYTKRKAQRDEYQHTSVAFLQIESTWDEQSHLITGFSFAYHVPFFGSVASATRRLWNSNQNNTTVVWSLLPKLYASHDFKTRWRKLAATPILYIYVSPATMGASKAKSVSEINHSKVHH
jgi:hypothetical protein